MTRWLGIDIGGANLKLADGTGGAWSVPFPLWKSPGELPDRLRSLLAAASPFDRLAVTMTGELADCFPDKTAGVRAILNAVTSVVSEHLVLVYTTSGTFVSPAAAADHPLEVAAANWHALATFAGRLVPDGASLLIDIGSTTCDLIPLDNGQPANASRTDTDRLVAGELVYTGVERSPVCGVVNRVPYRGRTCPVAHELFATMRDVWTVLGFLPEAPHDSNTADGRAATRPAATSRLGRMLCADSSQFDETDAVALARFAADVQQQQVADAMNQVLARPDANVRSVVISGQGDFLARMLCERFLPGAAIRSLAGLGPAVARCGPAHALAVLAAERDGSQAEIY